MLSVAPPLEEPPAPGAPPVATCPPTAVSPPVPGLPLVPGIPPELTDPPAPASAVVSAGEPPYDVQEAAVKKKRTQIHSAFSDFILLPWLSPLPSPSLLQRLSYPQPNAGCPPNVSDFPGNTSGDLAPRLGVD